MLCRDTVQRDEQTVGFKSVWRGVADSFILEKVETKREAAKKERNKFYEGTFNK